MHTQVCMVAILVLLDELSNFKDNINEKTILSMHPIIN